MALSLDSPAAAVAAAAMYPTAMMGSPYHSLLNSQGNWQQQQQQQQQQHQHGQQHLTPIIEDVRVARVAPSQRAPSNLSSEAGGASSGSPPSGGAHPGSSIDGSPPSGSGSAGPGAGATQLTQTPHGFRPFLGAAGSSPEERAARNLKVN